MAGIAPETLERIRAASDIVDIIGAYVPLKKAGANFSALCPFHREKTPSFNVNPHRQIFHCFGCHKGGDVFTFVKEFENIGFVDAVRRLADRAKIPLEFDSRPGEQQARHLKDQLLEIHEKIAQRWQNTLANEAAGQPARDYLAKRGVSGDAIKLFRLGAAPDAWDDTVNWAKSKNYELALVEKAGLILRKEETGKYYDRFRGRLMFPICDEQGRVVGFSGRVLSGDEKTAKYVNSPETPIFTKGKVLFALDKARKSILDLGFAVVCEGQLDTIACHSGGVSNAVAPQGTALTATHAKVLRRYTDDIILCFDGDAAGQRAAARAFDDLLAAGIPFRVVSIPPPDDPDSFIKKFGKDAFIRLLIAADDFHEFYLKYLCSQKNLKTTSGRQQVVQLMCESVQKTGSPTLIDTYAQRTAQLLSVSPEAVRAEFRRVPATKSRPVGDQEESPETVTSAETSQPPRDEFGILQILFKTDEFIGWMSDCFDPNWISNAAFRKIVEARVREHREKTWRGLPQFLKSLDDENLGALITKAVSLNYKERVKDHLRGRALPKPFEDLQGFAMRMRKSHMENELRNLESLRSTLEPGSVQQIEVIHKLQNLKAQLKEPLRPLKK
jgi:DNA primase